MNQLILKFSKAFIILVLCLFICVPGTVLAQDEEPAPEAEAGEVVDVPPESEATESPVVEETVLPTQENTLLPTESLPELEKVLPAEIEPVETEIPPSAEPELVTDVVKALDESDAVLVDEDGNMLPLATIEAGATLKAADPWFVDNQDSSHVIAYFGSQNECDAWDKPSGYSSYSCNVNPTPVQAAINDEHSNGTTINLSGTFTESVTIKKNVTLDGGGVTTFAPLTIPGENGVETVIGVIYIDGSEAGGNVHVVLKGLNLNGANLGAGYEAGTSAVAGVLVNDATVELIDNAIENFLSANGIEASGVTAIDSDLILNGNNISHNSVGISLQGDSTASGANNALNFNGIRVSIEGGSSAQLGLEPTWTDKADYSPGSVVTLSGDNSMEDYFLPGDTMMVEVLGPNGYAAACDATVDEIGTWSCQVTLWANLNAVGDYSYTATSLLTGEVFSGKFSDGWHYSFLQFMNVESGNCGAEVSIEVYLFYYTDGHNPIKGERVYVFFEEEEVASAVTNSNGSAKVKLTVPRGANAIFAYYPGHTAMYSESGLIQQSYVPRMDCTGVTVGNVGQPSGIVTGNYGETITVRATPYASLPIVFETFFAYTSITFKLNGETFGWDYMDNERVAYADLDLTDIEPGTYPGAITAHFPGGTYLLPSSGSATLVVIGIPVTVTANTGQSKVQGQNDPDLSYTSSNPDVTFTGSLSRVQGEDIGTYAITQGTLKAEKGYEIVFVPNNFEIKDKYTPVITWNPNPAVINYGTPLTAAQLNASARYNGVNVPGKFVYDKAVGDILERPSQVVNVTFTPTDTILYKSVTASATITVNKGTPAITWANPGNIVYGTSLDNSQLNAASDVSGVFTYNPPAGTVLNTGTHTLSVTFTPSDSGKYNPASKSVSLNVLQATPQVTWPAISPIVYGTPLSAKQLNATSPVAGTFNYQHNDFGRIYPVGSYSVFVDFTPDDVVNYKPVQLRNTLYVNKATPVVHWPFPASIEYGTPLGDTQLNATASTAGTFTYDPPAGTILDAGTHTLKVTFIPADTKNFYSPVTNYMNIRVIARTIKIMVTPTGKVYGDQDPELHYTFTPALVGTDSFSGELKRFDGEDVGNYWIMGGSLWVNNNYRLIIDYAQFSISKKPVTVFADPIIKNWNTNPDPKLTYTIDTVLPFSDTFSGSLERRAGEDPGDYPISQGNLALSANYDLSFIGNVFTIFKNPGPEDSDGDGILDAQDNCVSNANSDQSDSDRDGIGNACDSTKYGPTATLVVPVTGRAGFVPFNCFISTVLELPSSNSVNGSTGLCGKTGKLVEQEEDLLPDDFPAGHLFVSGVQLTVLEGLTAVAEVQDPAKFIFSFAIPAGMEGREFTVLHWDETLKNGAGDWVEIPAYKEALDGSPEITPLYEGMEDDGRLVLEGTRLSEQLQVTFSTNFTGLFVLAVK